MPEQPIGEIPPLDGSLPASAGTGNGERLSLYVHVPYCRVRCGYCDFNTYTADELGPGANRDDYREMISRELDLSTRVLAEAGAGNREVGTIFFGGGTPTILPAEVLAGVLSDIRSRYRLASDVEVTTEANPDTLSPAYLDTLAAAGFTRISVGMQSAVPHVLATLDRTHDPLKIPDVARWVKEAGLELSLDLIYGTPGESIDDWRASLDSALANDVDHISAYSLIVEPGTKMGAMVRRGRPCPMRTTSPTSTRSPMRPWPPRLRWYEVSNWSKNPDTRCEHNMAYWRGADWWGFGPGAHSHVGESGSGTPSIPAPGRTGSSPVTPRRSDGRCSRRRRARSSGSCSPPASTPSRLDSLGLGDEAAIRTFVKQGLLDAAAVADGRFSPTLQGRLMADHMVRVLTDYVR